MRNLHTCLAALFVSAAVATTAWAADQSATMKVALLDVSSVMPAGMAGYGMMGQGMMGNMMHPGMMGPGMMMGGMMSIRTDKASVKTGTVTFEVTNWSRSVLHEVLVVGVDNPFAPLPYDYVQARVPEEQIKIVGEAADLQPSASKTLEIALAPGSYLLICNVAGHYAAGMVTALTVAQ
ncbi:hypothetical protein SAZ10_10395 [Mesorhizobium sp. BAC0120]|uniref:hypothetical protein n=1 Tax=Mesorhizobium sp. BAC0120 TaxID=3090670 RepID=UPI00298CE6D3|nr:hypothetical protein [Mesorhizobium sp. BAC0120]MDW6022172.1 hypothetical protein [Mesorhizobium sp. BAC0120]